MSGLVNEWLGEWMDGFSVDVSFLDERVRGLFEWLLVKKAYSIFILSSDVLAFKVMY